MALPPKDGPEGGFAGTVGLIIIWPHQDDHTKQSAMAKDLFDVQSESNKLAYIPDQESYQKEEYWATPKETEEKGGGDCEDLAIWKYARLRAMGWKADHLLLWSVQVRARSLFHVILVAKIDGKEWLLDAPAAVEDPPALEPHLINSEDLLKSLWFLAGFNEEGWIPASFDESF
ncbi:MAG: transglutaminase-like cysteine peptidase [Bdellovibrionales bacterium]